MPENERMQHAGQHAAHGDDVNAKALAWTALAIAAVLALSGIGTYFLWQHWRPGSAYDGPNAAFDFTVAKPVLESTPQADRKAYEAEKERMLNSWQWVDPQAGIARIPLEQAMRIMAERGKSASSDARGQP